LAETLEHMGCSYPPGLPTVRPSWKDTPGTDTLGLGLPAARQHTSAL